MCDKKKKCKKRTHELLKNEKNRVMKETLEHLKTLREVLEIKQVA
jgi:hypothetical protein